MYYNCNTIISLDRKPDEAEGIMRAINFRPKVDPKKLMQIAKKQRYEDLSGFINDAIEEKLRHIHQNPRGHKLMNAIQKAVYEHNGWTFTKAPTAEAAEITKRARVMRADKGGTASLRDVIKKLEKI